MPQVTVERVMISGLSTIGFGVGRAENGDVVLFAGDRRSMIDLGEALQSASEPIVVDPPEEAIVFTIANPDANGR